MNDANGAASHCPTCGSNYRAGFTACADDGTTLISGPAPTPGRTDAVTRDAWGETTERAFDSPGSVRDEHPEPAVLCRLPAEEAVLLAGALAAAGIEAMAGSGGYHIPYDHSPVRSGVQDVLVPASRLEEAREIMREIHGATRDR